MENYFSIRNTGTYQVPRYFMTPLLELNRFDVFPILVSPFFKIYEPKLLHRRAVKLRPYSELQLVSQSKPFVFSSAPKRPLVDINNLRFVYR